MATVKPRPKPATVTRATERTVVLRSEAQVTQFILSRTGELPAKIDGSHKGTAESPNATLDAKESSGRQWFTLDVFCTVKGTWVAQVKYRAGSKIAREEPCDRVYVAPDAAALFGLLNNIDVVDEFVVGWPGDGAPEANRGRDFRKQDASVCAYAESEWGKLIERCAPLFGAAEEII